MDLVCDALQIDRNELTDFEETNNFHIGATKFVNWIFFIVLNLTLMLVPGYLTLDSEANLHSMIGALLLSFFLPIFIVFLTANMSPIERLIKFGIGYMVYFIMIIVIAGIPHGFNTGFFACILISLATLYFGHKIVKRKDALF